MKIPKDEKEKLLSMCQERWKIYGYSPQSLGWTKDKQDIRFQTLLSFFNLKNRSILDIGCGFGDINRVIRKKTDNYTYYGIDIFDEFIIQASEIYGNKTTGFDCCDFLDRSFSQNSYDYVVACGIFNFKFESINNYNYISETIKRMLDISIRGVAVDFLIDDVNFKRDHCFYSNLEAILQIVRSYSKNFILRSDYMPFEFSIICFKDDSFENSDTVFVDFKNERQNH